MRKPVQATPDSSRAAAAQYARATCALEGMRQTSLGGRLSKQFVDGDITIDQAIAQARDFYGLSR
jgi:hypothetical protein